MRNFEIPAGSHKSFIVCSGVKADVVKPDATSAKLVGRVTFSIILKWLQEKYSAEAIAYTAGIGQKIDRKKIFKNAKALGVQKVIIEDLKNLFVKEYVYPMIRGHAIYEGVYLLDIHILSQINFLNLQ
jgi:hypothetical protein